MRGTARLDEFYEGPFADRAKYLCVKVTDINAIMAYDLLSTPGLVIDERLVSSGRVPTLAERKKWIAA